MKVINNTESSMSITVTTSTGFPNEPDQILATTGVGPYSAVEFKLQLKKPGDDIQAVVYMRPTLVLPDNKLFEGTISRRVAGQDSVVSVTSEEV